MTALEDEFLAAGAQIVWVLEQGPMFQPGTSELCDFVIDELGGVDQGLCVGDSETMPTAGAFDTSPFSVGRGFDMIVPRSTMQIVWSSSHGTPQGNENLDGQDVLDKVHEVVAGL